METSTVRARRWRLNNPEENLRQQRLWYAANAKKVNEHKCSIGCSHCGYNKYGGALEWHHTNQDKDMNMNVMGYFGPKCTKEREKCILLCSNCHREEHYKMKQEQK